MQSKKICHKSIAKLIEEWFDKHARCFEWRTHSTPWGRLLCEYMAQQTQIERVTERWLKMIHKFPTPQSMAESSEQEVLLMWEGLGYYRRAKNLREAAKQIADDFGGQVPSDFESLKSLKGVGDYTAGAISSIAFGNRDPLVDGNVHRVLCRLFNNELCATPNAWSWGHAKKLVDESSNPSKFNEGLMELGATVCKPKSPQCDSCPLHSRCNAFLNKTQSQVPIPKRQIEKKREYHYAVLFYSDNKIALEQRGAVGLWAGMWQVPTIESSKRLSKSKIAIQFGATSSLNKVGKFEHALSHRLIEFHVYSCDSNKKKKYAWHSMDSIASVPLGNAQKKVIAMYPLDN